MALEFNDYLRAICSAELSICRVESHATALVAASTHAHRKRQQDPCSQAHHRRGGDTDSPAAFLVARAAADQSKLPPPMSFTCGQQTLWLKWMRTSSSTRIVGCRMHFSGNSPAKQTCKGHVAACMRTCCMCCMRMSTTGIGAPLSSLSLCI